MDFVVDETLLDEIERYGFQFNCEQCVHFDAERERCSGEYPAEPHRQRLLELGRSIAFCKHFELY